jgi:2-methylcitrate dehydratase PrpD
LAKKVRAVHGPELEKEFPKHWPAMVVITLKSGMNLQAYVPGAKGDPDLPLTDIELQAKFTRLAGEAVLSDSISSLLAALRRIDTLSDVNQLTSKLDYRTEVLASARAV